MDTFATFLLVYVLGGLTFLPICLAVAYYLVLLTCPQRSDAHSHRQALDEFQDALPDSTQADLHTRPVEPDVAAAYFAVCREYVPGGVNGKPPERTTPAGAVVGIESPSVYQSMYRTIFERNRSQGPSIEGSKNGKASKKARNVFFVVLRHGHLILFDDSEQVEVRYVISLAHRIVDVHAGDDAIPEGELWIKRNCIRLRRVGPNADSQSESRPFYLFSDNCSGKEDFYFALLRNQEHQAGMGISPSLQFEQPHVVKLVQQLHASEENLQTRWINAMVGRLFFALYKTRYVEDFVRTKITKKISRVAKPAFIQSIAIQRIAMGDSAPMITNPKLRELTLDGDLVVEADVKYNGNFRLEIAAVARIDLGSRFKARYVNMVLAGILKKLEGHVLVRVKPPPSNRLWLTFEHPPKMEMTIEPIVSSRQITYGMILRAIENRIREVVAETVVLPNWDDMPFFDTTSQPLRGGIWEDAASIPLPDADMESSIDDTSVFDGSLAADEADVSHFALKDEKTASMPSLGESDTSSLKSRKTSKSVQSVNNVSGGESASVSGVEVRAAPVKPMSMRSGSFAAIARPLVAQDTAVVEAQRSPQKHQHDAITAIKDISSRSLPTSPVESPVGSPPIHAGSSLEASVNKGSKQKSRKRDGGNKGHADVDIVQSPIEQAAVDSAPDLCGEGVYADTRPTVHSADSEHSSLCSKLTDSAAHSDGSIKSSSTSRKSSFLETRQMLNSATTAAKKWLASRQEPPVTQRTTSTQSQYHTSATGTPAHSYSPACGHSQQPESLWSQSVHSDKEPDGDHHRQTSSIPLPSTLSANTRPSNNRHSSSRSSSTSIPIGRGQPFPPPGQPLPRPARQEKWVRSSAQLLGLARKPVSTSSGPSSSAAVYSSSTASGGSQSNLPGHKVDLACSGHNGNGSGGDTGPLVDVAAAKIQIPAATAAPVGVFTGRGKEDTTHTLGLSRTRTTSSAETSPANDTSKSTAMPPVNSSSLSKERSPGDESARTHHDASSPQLPARVPVASNVNDSEWKNASASSTKDSSLINIASRRWASHRHYLHSNDEPQLLVVAAPLVESDASAPPTPVSSRNGDDNRDGTLGGKKDDDGNSDSSEVDLQGMAAAVVQPIKIAPSTSDDADASIVSSTQLEPSSPAVPSSLASVAAADQKMPPPEIAKAREDSARSRRGWFTIPSTSAVTNLPQHRR